MPMMMSIKVPFTLFFVTIQNTKHWFSLQRCIQSLLCAKRQKTASQIDFLSKQFSCGACAAIVCNSVVASVYVLYSIKREQNRIFYYFCCYLSRQSMSYCLIYFCFTYFLSSFPRAWKLVAFWTAGLNKSCRNSSFICRWLSFQLYSNTWRQVATEGQTTFHNKF